MLVENLVEKISDSLQDLGKIFDQIHKMPIRMREKYFESIQKLKDRLIMLKTNAKESNLAVTQKNYKQVFLNLHRLKEEIAEQLPLLQPKENRDPNRPSLKEIRKNHDDSMRLIVEKDQKIAELNQVLFQKEELIRATFEDLRKYKRESQQMTEQYRLTKNILSQLEIEYSSLKSVFIKAEEDNIDLQLKDQERQRCFRQTFEEMESLKNQLIAAQEKILYFEQLTELSMKKTKAVEESIRRVELEASNLNENYRRQQGENLKKLKQIQELTMELSKKDNRVIQQEMQINQLKQEVNLLEFELDKLQKFMYEERAITKQERNRKDEQITHYDQKIQGYRQEAEAFRKKMQELLATITHLQTENQQKSKEIRNLAEELEDQKSKVQEYLMMTLSLQNKQEQIERQIQQLQHERSIREEQLEKYLQLTKQLEGDIKNYQEKLTAKEEQRERAMQEIYHYQQQIQIDKSEIEAQLKQIEFLENELVKSKSSIIGLQQTSRQKDREIESFKLRFLRAKIQIIHEIRQSIQ